MQSLGDGRQLACYAGFEIPPHRNVLDVNADRPSRVGCPDLWRIAGSLDVYRENNPGDWSFWAYRGEWVTYMYAGVERPAVVTGDPSTRPQGLSAYFPRSHNWSSWSWPVRTYTSCEPIFRQPVARLAVAQSERDANDASGPDAATEGTAHDDVQHEGRGDDALFGGRGEDQLLGGRGDDRLLGGPGDDELFDDQDRDVLRGGPGNDRFSARDGDHDVIDCGPGEDVAIGDRHDTYLDCEHAYRSAADDPAHPPSID